LIKPILLLSIICSIALSPYISEAEANDSPYLGIQYAFADIGVADLSESFEPTTLVGRVGRYFRKHYAFEGRIAFPVSDDTKIISGTETSVGLFGLLGAYGAAHLNLGSRFSFYGIAGLTLAALQRGTPVASDSDSKLGLSYGVGADIDAGITVLNIEYMSYLDDDNFDFDALGVGIKIIF
jgi:opacity protein-like surface antigen